MTRVARSVRNAATFERSGPSFATSASRFRPPLRVGTAGTVALVTCGYKSMPYMCIATWRKWSGSSG